LERGLAIIIGCNIFSQFKPVLFLI